MADGHQKYMPVQHVPGKHSSLNHVDEDEAFPVVQLGVTEKQRTETKRMRSAHVPVVNPVTGGDRSLASKKRVYEKGRKNRTRS